MISSVEHFKTPKLFLLIAIFFLPSVSHAFDFDNNKIPLNEIRSGGPPKDGIPALLKPKFLSVSQVSYLNDEDRVVGVVMGQKAKAYPIRVLNWHELVNDQLNGNDILISWCPLCGTAMVFEAKIKGKKHTFGVSGLLYNSDVLMYDHQTESLWSQLKMQAVTGSMSGEPLKLLVSRVTSWKDWKTTYPKSLVLSDETGYTRDYNRDPYASYQGSRSLYFPVSHQDDSRHPKDWVFGLVVGNKSKAYPYKELAKSKQPVLDQFAGRTIRLHFDKENQSIQARTKAGQLIPGVSAFWFAWKAFYPESEVYKKK